jgi:GntR family transcriptional regulator
MPLPDVVVNRSSPVPLYFQVAEQLERAIFDGTLAPGDRIANEVELAGQLGLSRPTLRQAIQLLVDKGMLVRKRGVGTQVVHGRVRREVKLTSLYDDLSRTGQEPGTRVLHNAVEPASAAVAEELRATPGAVVRHLERLRLSDGRPLAILRNWLPDSLLAPTDEELEERGLYQLIRQRGIHMRVARQRIGARGATPEEAALLGEVEKAPLLTMERTTYDDQGRVVEFGSHVYRAESYSFEVTLVEG